MTKPKIMIMGGTGFTGRNLVKFLVENDLSEKIIVVDKVPPQMAWMNDETRKVFERSEIVEFRSANLIYAASVERAFEGEMVDFVVNCAGETRPGFAPEIYEESIFKLGVNCITSASKINGVKRFVQLSSCMNSSNATEVKEDCTVEPWSVIGKQHARLEQHLKGQNAVKYTIVRLPIVYGKGDRTGLTPRIIAAILYKNLNDTMKLLWTKDLKLNTVHVDDVSSSIFHLMTSPNTENDIFNVVDDSRSTQGSVTDILCTIFNIKCEYLGQILSKMTQLDVTTVVKEINEEHLEPWAKLCKKEGLNTPLTPYIDADALQNKHINMSNEKLLRQLSGSFQLKHPILTRELIQEIVDDYVIQKLLPK